MGSGKSRVVSRFSIVEATDGSKQVEYVNVDIDEDTIDRVNKLYDEGRLSFAMSSDEVIEYMQKNNVWFVWDWGLNDNMPEDFEVDMFSPVSAKIKSEDLRYHIYQSVFTMLEVQKAIEEATGNHDRLVSQLFFSDSLDEESRTAGRQEEMWDGEVKSKISIACRVDFRQSKKMLEFIEASRKGEPVDMIDVPQEERMSYMLGEGSSLHGWSAIGGAYARHTMTHEMGHALLTQLQGMQVVNGKKFDFDRVRDLVQKDTNFSSPVSGYSRKNYDEAWAECFTLYCFGGKSKSKMYKAFCSIMKDYDLDSLYGCLN